MPRVTQGVGRFRSNRLSCAATAGVRWRRWGGETLEWGLVCGLLVAAALLVMVMVGPKMTTMWNSANDEISATYDGGGTGGTGGTGGEGAGSGSGTGSGETGTGGTGGSSSSQGPGDLEGVGGDGGSN